MVTAFHSLVQDQQRRVLLLIVLVVLILVLILIIGRLLLNPANTSVRENEYVGIIFSGKKAADQLGVMLLNERNDAEYWTPSKDDIMALEKRFREYVEANLPALDPARALFRRQYYGFVRQNRPIIMIVGFCEVTGIDWRQELVTLPATSGCYVEAQYDVINDAMLYAWSNLDQ